MNKEFYSTYKDTQEFKNIFYDFEWDGKPYIGDVFSTKIYDIERDKILTQTDFLQYIYPDFGWIKQKLVGNEEIWPFYATGVEYRIKWKYITTKSHEFFDIKKISKDMITLTDILDKFAKTYSRNLQVGANWPQVKIACNNNQLDALKFYLNFGNIYQPRAPIKRADAKSSLSYQLIHDEDNSQTFIETKPLTIDDICYRFEQAQNKLISERRMNLAQMANNINLPFERQTLAIAAHRAFFGYYDNQLLSLNELDRSYCMGKVNDAIAAALVADISEIGNLRIHNDADFRFHFSAFAEDYGIDWNNFSFQDSSMSQTNQRQYAADNHSYEALMNRIKDLSPGTYITRAELKKDYGVSDKMYDKAMKMGWFEKETDTHRKQDGFKGKPRTYLKILEGGMSPEYESVDKDFKNLTFFPGRLGERISRRDEERGEIYDGVIEFDPDEGITF